MRRPAVRKCVHCKTFYLPDPRRIHDQRYCPKPECRLASKMAAQAKWRASAKGRDYFKGSAGVERVRAWRARRRERSSDAGGVLQDLMVSQGTVPQVDRAGRVVLQDLRLEQEPLFIGLIAQLSGVLQDQIEPVLQSLQSKGQMILGKGPGIGVEPERSEEDAGRETSVVGGTSEAGAGAV